MSSLFYWRLNDSLGPPPLVAGRRLSRHPGTGRGGWEARRPLSFGGLERGRSGRLETPLPPPPSPARTSRFRVLPPPGPFAKPLGPAADVQPPATCAAAGRFSHFLSCHLSGELNYANLCLAFCGGMQPGCRWGSADFIPSPRKIRLPLRCFRGFLVIENPRCFFSFDLKCFREALSVCRFPSFLSALCSEGN